MKLQPPAQARNPYLRAESLNELLSWHDTDFVRCAYVTLLGRQPDPDGEAHFTNQIRRGRSKLEVLWHLRNSDEASSHDPGIRGLDRVLRRARWCRLRFLGVLARLVFRSIDGDSLAHRQLRSVDNKLAQIYERLEKQEASTSRLDSALSINQASLDQLQELLNGIEKVVPANPLCPGEQNVRLEGAIRQTRIDYISSFLEYKKASL